MICKFGENTQEILLNNIQNNMTRKEERYVLETLERIRDETHENNIMLRQIIKYLNHKAANALKENEDDFGRNVLANLVSNYFNIKI